MTPEQLRAQLAKASARVIAMPGNAPDLDTYAGDAPVLIPAAVLVPIVLHASPGVLLTRRTRTLNSHAGQVAFPGGRMDPGDADCEATALREAEEEVSLPRAAVELVGRLPDHITGTGYLVSPVVGLLDPDVELAPNPAEVEEIFELPLSTVLDPAAPRRESAMFRGARREYWVWPHPTQHIWGATATILLGLANVLRDRS